VVARGRSGGRGGTLWRLALLVVVLSGWPLLDAAAQPTRRGASGEIINGRPVEVGAYPFIAAIQNRTLGGNKPQSEHWCGGTLIAPRFVLTAAHCTFDADNNPLRPNDLGVVVGQTIYGKGQGVRRDVGRIERFARYNARTFQNDVAVLVLDKPVTTIEPVTLISPSAPNLDKPGTKGTIAGWGSVTYSFGSTPADAYRTYPKRMREAWTRVVPNTTCGNAFGPPAGDASILCSLRNAQATCSGDSGGPLFVKTEDGYLQLGVTSFGEARCVPRFPQGFARLSHPPIAAFIRDAAGLSGR
jgi:secreted trypsin-like serine protease